MTKAKPDAPIGIVDYGVGNIGSVLNMLNRLRLPAVKVGTAAELRQAGRLILPGVGSFDHAMNCLRASGLIAPLQEQVCERQVPTLGICLGMHVMADGSEEGSAAGLGWMPGLVRRFDFPAGSNVKVPHMGWSYVDVAKAHPLAEAMMDDSRYYFVHSYHFAPADAADTLLTFHYGGQDFVGGIARGNIAAVQFHPEKSHRYGMALFSAFAAWAPQQSGDRR